MTIQYSEGGWEGRGGWLTSTGVDLTPSGHLANSNESPAPLTPLIADVFIKDNFVSCAQTCPSIQSEHTAK